MSYTNLADMRTDEIQELLSELEDEKNKYQKGFEIMYEFFDSISDEQKPDVDKELKKLGL